MEEVVKVEEMLHWNTSDEGVEYGKTESGQSVGVWSSRRAVRSEGITWEYEWRRWE